MGCAALRGSQCWVSKTKLACTFPLPLMVPDTQEQWGPVGDREHGRATVWVRVPLCNGPSPSMPRELKRQELLWEVWESWKEDVRMRGGVPSGRLKLQGSFLPRGLCTHFSLWTTPFLDICVAHSCIISVLCVRFASSGKPSWINSSEAFTFWSLLHFSFWKNFFFFFWLKYRWYYKLQIYNTVRHKF